MKSTFRSAGQIAAILSMITLTACATSQDAEHGQHHSEASTSQAPGMMSSGASDEQMEMMDMKTMCDMHDKMMSAKTPEERQAMMDERMKNMSPQMRQKQLEMMQNKCK